jgi:hypothetical protein
MALLAPAAGEMMLLDNALKTASPEALTLKLYSNNYDAVNGSTAANFTEATIAGYSAKALTRAGWNAAVSGNPSSSTYGTPQTFNFTGTGAIVGYYIVGTTSTTIYWAERLYATTGQTFNNGDSLTITPKITLT